VNEITEDWVHREEHTKQSATLRGPSGPATRGRKAGGSQRPSEPSMCRCAKASVERQ